MKNYGEIITSVTEFVVTLFLLMFAGNWLDKHFQTGYRYVAIGTVIGFIAGMVRMALKLKAIGERPDDGK